MLPLMALGLKHLLHNALNDINYSLALLPHRVQFPLKSAHCLPDLGRDHFMEFFILFSMMIIFIIGIFRSSCSFW